MLNDEVLPLCLLAPPLEVLLLVADELLPLCLLEPLVELLPLLADELDYNIASSCTVYSIKIAVTTHYNQKLFPGRNDDRVSRLCKNLTSPK